MEMGEHATILVVEDEPLILEIMSESLYDHGFTVVCVGNVAQARAVLEQQPDVEAVFVDIDLGDFGGGYEVARYARERRADINVIYTSGGARGDFSRNCVSDAVFVPKPYLPSRVCALLEQRIGRAA